MKKNCKKYLLLVLCSFLLLQCLTLSALAVPDGDELDPENPYLDSNGYVIWSYSSDTDTIRGLGREYSFYKQPQKLLYDAPTRYYFENEITVDDMETPIHGYSDNPEILEMSYWAGLYVTEAGRVSLDALCAGKAVTYRLRSNGAYYCERTEPLEEGLAQSFAQGTEKETFDVIDLQYALVCYVYGYDGTDAYGCEYGGIYQMNGSYYYIHYLTLSNQYFDAEGNFSYRSGTVEAVKLDEQQAVRVSTLTAAMKEHIVTSEWESDKTGPQMNRDGAVVFFVLMVVFLGIVVPLPLLIVGICMARSLKRRCPTYWYALSVVAVLWMLVALALMILVL